MTEVAEIVVYTISDVEKGIEASLGIIEECRAITDGMREAQTYQSIRNPEQIIVRVIWTSLEEAERVANWVMQNSPSYQALNQVTKEQMIFDHFKEV